MSVVEVIDQETGESALDLPLRFVLDPKTSLPARHGRRHLPSCCTYVVYRGDECLYVGATAVGIRTRLGQHKTARSPLGKLLREAAPDYTGLTIQMIRAPRRQQALSVEKKLIAERGPLLNVSH